MFSILINAQPPPPFLLMLTCSIINVRGCNSTISSLINAQVTPGGKAGKGGVREGDYIIAINGDSTEGLLHFDAQQMIKATGMSLQLKLSS